MTKYDQLETIVKENKGYLFAADVANAGISRTYMASYVKENNLEMVAKGIYVTEDTWPDQLYILQHNNSKAIFSGETALYLNILLEREYSEIVVSVPKGHNGSRLRERGVIVHHEKEGLYGMGQCKIKTNYGNTVIAYNRERCICDLVKRRHKIEVQTYQNAIKSFMANKDKDLSLLIKYAEFLKIRDEIMKYVEVLV